MPKNILSLTAKEAFDFLMKSEQYHSFELPEYFVFDEVLEFVHDTIGDKKYDDCLANISPDNLGNVNLDILLNKDGKYAVRPLVLANPYLYYFLVRELCNPSGWNAIQKCFKAYEVPHLSSCALPVVPDKVESFHKSTTILNWWNAMEQRSIELSMEYRYMFITDITNCYGSINPQSIEWALACKNTRLENNSNGALANNIQKYLRALQHGHNIGIPQGSALFDFVGEIVLGYSDLLFHEALQRENITGYEVIRYRDDYRIFCNDRDKLEHISYILQHVLESLNLRLNSQKTKISDSIVTDSIKSDKLQYIYNTPIFNKKGCDFDSFEKHLLFILLFGRDFPNSGQLKNMLSDIDKRIKDWLQPYDDEVFTESSVFKNMGHRKIVGGSILAMTSVAAQIALENVSVSHYALRVISRMIDSLEDTEEKRDVIEKVYNKLCKQPNSDYNQLWLQNITYCQDSENGVSPYEVRLCKVVMGEDVQLWNNEWLKTELSNDFPQSSIIDEETLAKVTPVITFRESRIYSEYFTELEKLIDESTIVATL